MSTEAEQIATWQQRAFDDAARIQELELEVAGQASLLVTAQLRVEQLELDRAFFLSCALSGEVPAKGAEPSAGKANASIFWEGRR